MCCKWHGLQVGLWWRTTSKPETMVVGWGWGGVEVSTILGSTVAGLGGFQVSEV